MKTIKSWWQAITFWFWKVVFWWKHKTGFIDLGQDIEVEGEIVWTDYGKNPDGDFCFNLKLRPEYWWANYAFGRKTSENEKEYPDTIHCEITPYNRADFSPEVLAKIQPGQAVRVAGRWGFDGVHVGKAEWIEVIYALWRHQPNVLNGWCEIHPVTKIEIK